MGSVVCALASSWWLLVKEEKRRPSATNRVVVPNLEVTLRFLGRHQDYRAKILESEGRFLLSVIKSWQTTPPTDDDKTKTFKALASWHERAEAFLTGPV